MSRCDRCGGKDHATSGHDAWAADVLATQRADSLRAAARCSFVHPNGSRCDLLAVLGQPYCEAHPPGLELRDDVAAALASGAKRRAGLRMSESLDVEALLTFEPESNYSTQVLTGRPQKPFLPRGLMLWGVAGRNLQAMLVGRNNELVASFGLVPAEWFMTSQSFEQVVKAHAEGVEPGRGWGHWSTAHPGMLVRLVFDQPVDGGVRALMWGWST